MKLTSTASLILAMSVLSSATIAQPSSLETAVDRHLKPYVETGNFSGSVLIGRKGKVLFSRGYGPASLEQKLANAPNTAYHLASVSRIFTSAAILLLEQQGKLKVEDAISGHLTGWPRGDEITIHHLLSLSAGLPNINSLPGYSSWSQSPQTPGSLVEKFRDLPLEYPPGSRTAHSNSNYNLLALLIERISGKSYGKFLSDEIFAPLQMLQTGHDDDPSRKLPNGAVGYTPVGMAGMKRAPTLDWSVKTGNGSLYSTTEDLYRFDRMLVGEALLSAKSVRKLFTEHFPNHGYGWFVREHLGATEVYINGRSPGFGAYWGRSVEEDVTVILLGNLYSSATTPIGRNLMEIALGREVETTPIRRERPDPALLAELVGTYQFGPDFYRPNGKATFRIEDGHLFYRSNWMIPAGGTKFIHRVYWSNLEFLRDSSGKIVKLKFDDFVGVKM